MSLRTRIDKLEGRTCPQPGKVYAIEEDGRPIRPETGKELTEEERGRAVIVKRLAGISMEDL